MPMQIVDLSQDIASEIRADVETLLTPEGAQRLCSVLRQRGVVVVKRIDLTDAQQLALSALMGTLRMEGEGGLLKITLDKKVSAGADYLKGSLLWHMDGTHDQVPVFASLLSARKLADVGGQTEFANSYAAYEALPAEMKARIEDLQVVHSVGVSMRRAGVEETPANLAYWNSIPDQTHKLVWTHKSGRKSLVIGCHAARVVGMPPDESEKLLRELLEWTTQTRFKYRHEWDDGDLVIWDNTGVLHRAEAYAADSGRLMHRTTLLGEEAFA